MCLFYAMQRTWQHLLLALITESTARNTSICSIIRSCFHLNGVQTEKWETTYLYLATLPPASHIRPPFKPCCFPCNKDLELHQNSFGTGDKLDALCCPIRYSRAPVQEFGSQITAYKPLHSSNSN